MEKKQKTFLNTFVIYVNEKQVIQTEHAKTNRCVRESRKNKHFVFVCVVMTYLSVCEVQPLSYYVCLCAAAGACYLWAC